MNNISNIICHPYLLLNSLKYKYLEITRDIRCDIAVRKLRHKNVIKCVFFATFDTSWKCDSVYREMLNSPYFEPLILICPVVNYGYENMLTRMHDCESLFISKKYKYIKAYDEISHKYVDVQKDIKPDIIFFTSPYQGLVDNRYFIDRFPNKLCCYVPYFYIGSNNAMFFDTYFHHLLWRFYIENEQLLNEYRHKSNKDFRNVRPVGYCAFDDFYKRSHYDSKVKTIIWAPHHGVDNKIEFIRSSFMQFNSVFFELADEYQGRVHFVFRPHPLLKNNLYKHPDWGKEKTDSYYKEWELHTNCSIKEKGDYVELFNESDAMIHDCGSFMTEYLYFDKPCMFTVNDEFSINNYFQSAVDAEHCYYQGNTIDEIRRFINDVVLNFKDTKAKDRNEFINKYIRDYRDVGRSIVNDIVVSLKGR